MSSSWSPQYVAGRAAGAQHAGTGRIRRRNPRRDDRPRAARAAAQGPTHHRHPDQRPRMRLCRARAACSSRLPVRFKDEAHLLRIINKIVSAVGRRVDEIASAVRRAPARRLARQRRGPPDRRRRPAGLDPQVLQEASSTSTSWSRSARCGRRWPKCWPPPSSARITTIISGGTGSGKTTMLNALSAFISDKERLITIEDAAELQLQQPHVGRMETRPPNIEGKGEIRQRDLVKNALRMRPDRIILGECRGEEAFDMLQAMNTGHEGSMATIHANTPRDAISRLEQMIGMAGLPMTVAVDPRPDRRRRPPDRAAVAPVRRQAQGDVASPRSPAWKATSSRCRRSSNSSAPAPRADGTVERPFPGDRRAPALPHRISPPRASRSRQLFRSQSKPL